MTTGFNLVARLGPSGHAGGNGIYAIYDMFPRDEFADYDQYLDDDYDDYLASEEYVANGGQGFDHGPEHDKRLRQRQFKHSYWGIPPVAKGGNEKEQFSCAKLADRFSDLGKAYRVVWMDKIEHPVELVRVVRSRNGGVLRATVDEEFGGREGRGTETGSED
jgi:hypothetical protein